MQKCGLSSKVSLLKIPLKVTLILIFDAKLNNHGNDTHKSNAPLCTKEDLKANLCCEAS